MKKLLVAAMIILAAGCAKRPEEIMATAMPTEPYMRFECPALASMKMQKQAEVTKLELAQDKTAKEDAAAMTIIHVPMASMRGLDRSEELARAKGEYAAMDQAYVAKRCGAAS